MAKLTFVRLWLFLLLALTGCLLEPETEDEMDLRRARRVMLGDESARWQGGAAGWGRQESFGPPWVLNAPRAVTSIESPDIWRVPKQQVLLLSITYQTPPGAGAQNGILRWQLQAGVGGARETYLLDAIALQQITVPFESVRVSLVAQDVNGAFDFSQQFVIASALAADGTGTTAAAQFTQFFNVPLGPAVDFPIPKGASAFRIVGNPGGASDPFAAGHSYSYRQAGGIFFDIYDGPQMLAVRNAGVWLPLSGTPDVFRIAPAGAGAFGAIVWSLEL